MEKGVNYIHDKKRCGKYLKNNILTMMKVSNNLYGITFNSINGAEFEKISFQGGKLKKCYF